ncbi:MAG: 50S ribosomal protein L19 [Chloroflexota bacterium]|nr:50S ribosomal protein L19 [Chloroflexota bacterium]
MDLVAAVTKSSLKSDIPDLKPGDRVKVHTRIVEGDRERIQVFQGTIMRLRKGKGINAAFTVRRIATHGVGVERTFLLNSPRVEKIEVAGHSHVRRAQLYYLRGRRGKAARMREKRSVEVAAPEATEAPAEE